MSCHRNDAKTTSGQKWSPENGFVCFSLFCCFAVACGFPIRTVCPLSWKISENSLGNQTRATLTVLLSVLALQMPKWLND